MDMKQSTIEQQRLDQARLEANGMYSSQFEKDACGMGFVVNIKGKKSHDIIDDGLRTFGALGTSWWCRCRQGYWGWCRYFSTNPA
ncbi:MAG: hypothetical protein ACLRUM_08320 [Veillonella parvula]